MHTLSDLQKHLKYDPDTGVFTWRAGNRAHKRGDIAGYFDSRGYILICLQYHEYRAHRLAWLFVHGEWPTQVIDHINGNRQDNRIANLRDVSVAENCQGFRTVSPRNKTGITGVGWSKQKNCFTASKMIDGKSKFLGCFDTLEEAAAARADADNLPGASKTYRPRRKSVT